MRSKPSLGTLIIAIAIGSGLPIIRADAAPVTASEFYHAEFDHYFTTVLENEVTLLDNGTIRGWTRTAVEFIVQDRPALGLVPVCRFFSTSFAPKSSHFYTAFASECETVKRNPDWTFEAEAFYVELPTASGSCPAGRSPIYRLYNGGQSGAPNHKFTPYRSQREEFIGSGYVPEGLGADGVVFCVQTLHSVAQARVQAIAGRSVEFRYTRGQPWIITATFGAATATGNVEFPFSLSGTNLPALAGFDPYGGKYVTAVRVGGFDHVFLYTLLGFTVRGCAFQITELSTLLGPCHPLTGRVI